MRTSSSSSWGSGGGAKGIWSIALGILLLPTPAVSGESGDDGRSEPGDHGGSIGLMQCLFEGADSEEAESVIGSEQAHEPEEVLRLVHNRCCREEKDVCLARASCECVVSRGGGVPKPVCFIDDDQIGRRDWLAPTQRFVGLHRDRHTDALADAFPLGNEHSWRQDHDSGVTGCGGEAHVRLAQPNRVAQQRTAEYLHGSGNPLRCIDLVREEPIRWLPVFQSRPEERAPQGGFQLPRGGPLAEPETPLQRFANLP